MNANQHGSLPVPDAESLARSALLAARIAADIDEAGGWLPFSRYMERVLYTPGLGYYSGANVKFGRTTADGSDFITAPEMSPFFGRALAQPIAEALALADADEILEFGAGTGKLAAELLNALEALDASQPVDAVSRSRRPAQVVRRCRQYTIIELSGELRERQRATIEARAPALLERVRWLDRLPTRFSGVVIGNEVLDAMPIELHSRIDGEWFARGVGLDGSHLIWADRPVASRGGPGGNSGGDAGGNPGADASADAGANNDVGTRASAGLPHMPDLPPHIIADIEAEGVDYVVETHPAARAFIKTVCTMLERGVAIFIDYGFPAHEYYHPQRAGGTLMCHFRHQAHQDPLIYPGLQDVTAHVEFSGLAEAALEAGADVLGYMSQARFLINAGIADQLSRDVDPREPARYLPAASGVQKLLSESEMGELFKVIGFGRGLDDIPHAFVAGDRSWTLLPEDDAPEPIPTDAQNGKQTPAPGHAE